MNYLNGLNEQQKQAVMHTEGPLLVVAGAGTGKTKTLTHRILHLIHNNVEPWSILAITFTNKAATEMRERVIDMLGSDDHIPKMSTFHSLGVQILRQWHQKLGISKYFNILDTQDKTSLIKQAMKHHDIDPKQWEPRKIASVISRAKANEKTAENYEPNKNPLTQYAAIVWTKYEELKRAEGSLDFDDLLSETYFLLRDDQEVREYYQNLWGYIHVDEYQDTNTIQYKIVKTLAEKHKNICAVGDGDQNIYSWRGADMKNILNFEKDFPGARVIILETNYRSTQNILQAAHDIISKNTERIEKKLVTENHQGEKILLYEGFSANQEASWVANKTQYYIRSGTEPKDIAVLFRTNFQSRILEEAFLNRMIPYQVVGVKFFQRKEIKDVMSYLKAAFNRESLSDIRRVINEPKRGLGKVAIAHVFAGQAEKLSAKAKLSYESFIGLLDAIYEYAQTNEPSETIKYIIKHTGFEKKLGEGNDDDKERLENMKELVTYAKKYDDLDDAYDRFFEEVALLSDQDSLGSNTKDSNTVKLMTIHSSKGLEFKHVFVVGLEQGLFPSERDEAKNKHEDEEERRLCYVAFTRAKDQLHVSYAKLRTIYGQQRINEPSEFLRDISDTLIDYDEDSYSNMKGSDTSERNYYNQDDDGEITETFYLDF
ncbi:MAG: UvrD-helicase domain-containing protein [Candidatus Pacebacteria bacterium]|nr:UvrD-helicase domain-containing protein [Candidatus Paceibacterota bacterium]